MKIGIYYNEHQVERTAAEALATSVRAVGGESLIFTRTEDIGGIDRLVVLGGDGTVLHAAKRVAELSVPLVGVNCGRIGFLTEFEREEIDKVAELALRKDCPRMERTMLEVRFNETKSCCLNELALLHGVMPGKANRVEKISVAIDGSPAGDFMADGLIVATPTGTTAHSLSAGGSIMTPDCATFLLTPVCAFSLKSRPIAFSDSSELTFSLAENDEFHAYGDGVFLGTVRAGDTLTVGKSERKVVFLTRDKHGFFRRLTQKIN